MMSLKIGLVALGSLSAFLAAGSLVAGSNSQSATRKQQVDTRVVFQRMQFSKWNGTGKSAVAIMNLDGSGFRQLLAHNGIAEDALAWSPHKDRIAFVKMGVGVQPAIWIMATNGHSQRRVRAPQPASPGLGPAEPDWSPTGRSILFRMGTQQGFALWTVNVRTGKLRQLTSGVFADRSPQWSPDGTRIGFERDGTIMTMRLRDHRLSWLGAGYGFAWSPDSRRIAYSHNSSLWLMHANGSQNHRVGVYGIDGFTWSADGQWIVYNGGNGGGGDLFAIHPDGSGRHVIRHESGGPNGWHALYPDG
jgi:Tol biopolymer transport system component